MKDKSEFTALFATNYQKAMQSCGVLDQNGAIIIEKLQTALMSGKLDVN